MDIGDIVSEYLFTNGFGGLHNDDCGCFCEELFPCGEGCDKCEPAYKVPAHCDTCEVDCESRGEKGIEWCLTTKKPAAEKRVEACPPDVQQLKQSIALVRRYARSCQLSIGIHDFEHMLDLIEQRACV